ncbi:hypothetical protein QJS04_geneDACA017920 [Acorus gramineus]|uniref:Protein SLOW GREEN 1, chloroplastic n=1 Tax=Acorus gramineus TaxID=55184 RepID=A0AAV9ALW4_ACOGR|nr:hypothetical protein QJS04_geneDACA017920 [Acorus gramineus]
METLAKIHHTKPLLLRPSPSPRPLLLLPSSATSLSFNRRPKTLILRSSLKHHPPKPPKPSPLLSAAATAAASVALLVAGLQRPPLASSAPPPPLPPPLTESLSEEEERRLEDHLASHPDDTESLRALTELKIRRKKIPDAISAVDRLIQIEPDEKELPLLKAHLQTQCGDVEAARAGFEEILATDPFCVEAYHGLVTAAARLGDPSAVEEELEALTRQIEAAMEGCEREKRREDLRDFGLLLAQVAVIRKDYERAIEIYKELVKGNPRDFRPYLCQGIVYTLMKKKSEAEKQFEKYRRLVPKGHPYAKYFNGGMAAMKAFSEILV